MLLSLRASTISRPRPLITGAVRTVLAGLVASAGGFTCVAAERPPYEQVMRQVQARRSQASSYYTFVQWPNGPHGEVAPLFPPDGYYGADLTDSEKQQLRTAIQANLPIGFVERPVNGRRIYYTSSDLFQSVSYSAESAGSGDDAIRAIAADLDRMKYCYGVGKWIDRIGYQRDFYGYDELANGNGVLNSNCVFNERQLEGAIDASGLMPKFTESLRIGSTICGLQANPEDGWYHFGLYTYYFYELVKGKYEIDIRDADHGVDIFVSLAVPQPERNDLRNMPVPLPSTATSGDNYFAVRLARDESVGRISRSGTYYPNTDAANSGAFAGCPQEIPCWDGDAEYPIFSAWFFGSNPFYVLEPNYRAREKPSETCNCETVLKPTVECEGDAVTLSLGGCGAKNYGDRLVVDTRARVPNQSEMVVLHSPLNSGSSCLSSGSFASKPKTGSATGEVEWWRVQVPSGRGMIEIRPISGAVGSVVAKWYSSEDISGSWPNGIAVNENATPLRTVTIEKGEANLPDPQQGGQTKSVRKVRVTEQELGGQQTAQEILAFSSHTTHAKGIDSNGNALSREWSVRSTIGNDHVSTVFKGSGDYSVISEKQVVVESPIGSVYLPVLAATCLQPSADPLNSGDRDQTLITKWAYYDDAGVPASYRRLKHESRPDGGWTRYFYNSSGTVSKIVENYLDRTYDEAVPAESEARNVVTTIEGLAFPVVSATPVWWGTPVNSNGKVVFKELERTTVFMPKDDGSTVASVPVRVSYKFRLGDPSNANREITWRVQRSQTETPSDLAALIAGILDPSGNGAAIPYGGTDLVDVTERTKGSDGVWQITKELSSAGTLTTRSEDGLTVNRGFPSMTPPGGSASDFATKHLQTFLWYEKVVRSTNSDTLTTVNSYQVIPGLSNRLVSRSTESDPDVFGRATKRTNLAGTFQAMTYGCCGLLSQTDVDGTTTTFERDALGRMTGETRDIPGGRTVTTSYVYDSNGRVVRTLRRAGSSPDVVMSATTYDLAGRVTSETQEGVTTQYSYSRAWTESAPIRVLSSSVVRTQPSFTSYSGNTVTPTSVATQYPDGRMLSVGGNTQPSLTYSYDVQFVTSPGGPTSVNRLVTRVTAGASEWTETISDALGRVELTRYSDGATSKVFFGAKGKMVRQDDPDGVRTLFESGWDNTTKTEYSITAIDMDPTPANSSDDRNGQIDLSGADRVTRTDISIATNQTAQGLEIAKRTTTQQLSTVSNGATWTTLSTVDRYVTGTTDASGNITSDKVVSRRGTATSPLVETSVVVRSPATHTKKSQSTRPDGTIAISRYQFGFMTEDAVQQSGQSSDWLLRTYTYDNHGRMLTITDRDPTGGLNHPTTTYAYVPFPGETVPASDRVASITQSPVTGSSGSQSTSFEYDALGRQNVVYLPESTANNTKKVTSYFDAAGRVTNVRGDRTYPVDYSYDAQGRIESLTTYKSATKEANGSWTVETPAVTKWEYDTQRGWLKKKWYADPASSQGNPTTAGPEYTYTAAGRLATRKWARGSITTYAYSEAGDLKGRTYNDTITPPVTLSYDRRGRMTGVVDVAGTRAFTYDIYDRVTDELFTAGTFANLKMNQAYSTLGLRTNLNYQQVVGGTTTELSNRGFGYDALSRPNRFWVLDKPAGGSNWYARFDAKYDYELLGNRPINHKIRSRGSTSIGTSSTAVPSDTGADLAVGARTYDSLGRLSGLQWSSYAGPSNGTFVESYGYTYNSANQRTKQTVGRGGDRPDYDWDFGYDQFGQLTGATKKWTQVTPPQTALGQDFGYAYDAIGNRTQTTLSDTSGTYAASTYDSNLLNQYTQRTVPRVFDFMGYSALNPAYVQLPGENSPGVAAARQPTYPNSTVGPYFRRNVQWSGTAAVGDVASGAQSIPYFVPATPEVYTYDADGNLTSDGRCTYTWNGENQLVQVDLKAGLETLPSVAFEGSWVYEYDYIGRRVRKYRRTMQIENMMMNQGVGGEDGMSPQNQSNFGEGGGELGTITDETKFLYDGWLLTMELSGYAVIRSYHYGLDLSGSPAGAAGIGGLLFQLNGSATPGPTNTRWFCYDPQGNVTSLRSVSDNTRIASLETGPYGDQAIADGQVDEMKLRFSGKYWDAETGHSYYGYRYYSSQLGRWLSRDPAGESAGTNLFVMPGNSPVSDFDPLGLWIFVPNMGVISGSFGRNATGELLGASITLRFMPNKNNFRDSCYDCKQIRWVQLANKTTDGSLSFSNVPLGRWSIDANSSDMPYYPQSSEFGSPPGDPRDGKESALNDSPYFSTENMLGVNKNSTINAKYESCAICSLGQQKGAVYGCVRWNFEAKVDNSWTPKLIFEDRSIWGANFSASWGTYQRTRLQETLPNGRKVASQDVTGGATLNFFAIRGLEPSVNMQNLVLSKFFSNTPD